MKKTSSSIIGAAMLSVPILAGAAESPGEEYKPLNATYSIYSGQMGDERGAPTATDRKLAIAIEGSSAKDIFDSIGPDVRLTCSQEKGDRERRKGEVSCSYAAKGAARGYRCWIGVDLRTGKSIPGVSC